MWRGNLTAAGGADIHGQPGVLSTGLGGTGHGQHGTGQKKQREAKETSTVEAQETIVIHVFSSLC